MDAKQVIVVRKDLNMSKGKMAAQVSHASMGTILKFMNDGEGNYKYQNNISEDECPVRYWLNNSFTKIVVYVRNLNQLEKVERLANENKILTCKITDDGRTEFNGEPTVTCLGLGPDWNESFEGITSKLRLVQ